MKNVHDFNRVICRARPEDKLAMVIGLKQLGRTVAVTGCGTNDAPALANANIGLALGLTGTEIAKQASDLILIDDSLRSVVSAVKWGRNLHECVQKTVQFQLTGIFSVVMVTVVTGLFSRQSMLNPVQLLWVRRFE
jgi:Ca2+-transporting ATPase